VIPLSSPLISASDLAAGLGNAKLVIVDCRHELQASEAGQRKFTEGHIPGAHHAHLDHDLARPPGERDGRHPLPTTERFTAVLRHLGVCNDSLVVAYDDCGGAMAARLWWMLRWVGHAQVVVLDGGIQAWMRAGGALESGAPANSIATEFAPTAIHDEWIIGTEELAQILVRGEIVLLDARARQRFEGRTEPIDPVAGHIPGAVNLPFSDLLNDDGTFLGAGALEDRFVAALGGNPVEAAVTMCGSGVTACHLQLGLEAAGPGMARLYVGSWSEWIRDPERAVVQS